VHRQLLRYSLRRRIRAVLAVGVLCGVVAGIGLWGLAAARRTSSTYERYLRAAEASDVSVNVNTFDRALTHEEVAELSAAAAALPGVTDDASYIAMESMALPADLEDGSTAPEFLGSLDGRFLVQDRIAVIEGRLPRADRADEILVNEVAAANRDLAVGDRTPIYVADIELIETTGEIEVVGELDVEVVGIGTFPTDVLDDEYDRLGRLLLTPAATEEWIDEAGSYVWHGLRLEDPSDADQVVAAYRELAGEGVFLNTLVTAEKAADVQRALRPVVGALAVLGAAALLAGLGLGVVAAARLARGRAEVPVLRAVGLSPRSLALFCAIPAVAGALLAGVVAVIVAVALSPLAPLGAIRAVEPDRGVHVDGLAVVAGAGAVAVVLLGVATFAALAAVRVRPALRPPVERRALRGLGAILSPASAVGVRRGLGTGPVAGAPTRATLVGVAVAVVAVVGALTFGASLDDLSEEPASYGWATDLALVAGAGYDTVDAEAATRIADADDRIDGLSVAGFTNLEIEAGLVPAMSIEALRGSLPITVLDGRVPNGPDEVALGRRTSDRLGAGLGDDIEGPGARVQVVGIVAFPALGQATSSHPAMGEGALFTIDGLDAAGAQPSVVLLDLADGVEADSVASELTERFAPATDAGVMQPYTLLRPAELDGARDANGTIGAIAAVLAAAAVAGLAAVTMASVRARRRELAILRALGFTGSDLRRSVRWQAGSMTAVAVVVGVPLGVALGRLVWQTFAETLGVDSVPTVALVLILAIAAGAMVLAVAVALPAAHLAARMSVAGALRPE
jgi:ABC-type lipoprotein release transport system permease subunit